MTIHDLPLTPEEEAEVAVLHDELRAGLADAGVLSDQVEAMKELVEERLLLDAYTDILGIQPRQADAPESVYRKILKFFRRGGR